MQKRIGYLAVVLAVVYLYFMYNETVISGILVFFLLYFALSTLYLLCVRGKLTADLERVPEMGEKGKTIRAGVTLHNHLRVGWLRCEVCVSVRNVYDKTGNKQRLRGLVEAGGQKTLWCMFESGECGNIEVCLEQVVICDFLGFFSIRKKENKKASVRVMPEFGLMPLEITRRTREFQAEAEEYSGMKRGDDPSEIYQVREYRIQDPLKDIHWKLSAKEDQLMVRERGFPLGCVVLIWFDVREGSVSGRGFSEMIGKAASLSVTLAEEKCIHMAAWYEEKTEQIVRCAVRDQESACDMVWRLMELEPCGNIRKRDICYEETFRGQGFSSIVTIDGEGNLWQDGEKQEFLRL